ncbi:MAG: hypothetical protein ACIAZJ_15020 [Gimesia chilikensis]|uniref:hypothetical protein n=1 Tax=Gimesia chilikensis TaxID=2605989 RepID=UPI0037A1D6F7
MIDAPRSQQALTVTDCGATMQSGQSPPPTQGCEAISLWIQVNEHRNRFTI